MDKQRLKIKEPGLWEIQDSRLAFPGSLTDLIFIRWVKNLPWLQCRCPHNEFSKKKKIVFH